MDPAGLAFTAVVVVVELCELQPVFLAALAATA
jgi:hypothetical protein